MVVSSIVKKKKTKKKKKKTKKKKNIKNKKYQKGNKKKIVNKKKNYTHASNTKKELHGMSIPNIRNGAYSFFFKVRFLPLFFSTRENS